MEKWESYGKHWIIWFPGVPAEQQWVLYAESHDEVITGPPPEPPDEGGGGEDGTGEEECLAGGGTWQNERCAWPNCPLLIDADGDGFQLTSAEHGVRFDLDSDGIPEQIAWTRRDSDDAWLVLDRNGNGRVDDGTELFGNFTPAYADRSQPGSENGFVALRFTEGPSYGTSMADDVIDASDAVFRRLLLWRDTNHNGISEPEELAPAGANGLASISTDYRESRRRDRFGNEYRQVAGSLWRTAHGWQRRFVVDVWLKAIH